MKQVVTETLTQIVLAVITLLGSYAVYYIRKGTEKLKVETEKLKDDQQKQLADTALYRLDDIATKTVKSLEQTTAKELREAVKDGKIDKSELKKLSDVACKDILNTLEPEYVAALSTTMGDLKKYIMNVIESKVYDLKNETANSLLLPQSSIQNITDVQLPNNEPEANTENDPAAPTDELKSNTQSNTQSNT